MANLARSELVKNFREAIPRAKWKIDAPIIMVLSTSKNAAAVRSARRRGPLGGRFGLLQRDGRLGGGLARDRGGEVLQLRLLATATPQ